MGRKARKITAARKAIAVPGRSPEQVFTLLCRHVPTALAVRETHRYLLLDRELPGLADRDWNVLDAGCGDGVWWLPWSSRRFRIHGVDISPHELRGRPSSFDRWSHLDISQPGARSRVKALGWPSTYELIVANCSFEHIHDVGAALANVRQLLTPSGIFALYVPSPQWVFNGRGMEELTQRFPRIGMALAGLLNGFFQHRHLQNSRAWSLLLRDEGFRIEKTLYFGNRKSETFFNLSLPAAFIAFVGKKLFGTYPVSRLPWALRVWGARQVARLAGGSLNEMLSAETSRDDGSSEYLILCRRSR